MSAFAPMVSFEKVHPNAKLPVYATAGAAGADLCCVEDFTLAPGRFKLVYTGLRIALPRGYEGQVRPRSGLAAKFGVTVLNAPGTIDSDYRGEIGVLLINHGDDVASFKAGDRVAQLVIATAAQYPLEAVLHLSDTVRGSGGFGSTGT